MIKAAVDGKYTRSIKRVSDTSLPEAVIRNGVIFNAEAVMILSARATYLAKSLDLEGVKDLYRQRVKMLVVVDSGEPQDVPAMRKVLLEFPAPLVFCGKSAMRCRFPAPASPGTSHGRRRIPSWMRTTHSRQANTIFRLMIWPLRCTPCIRIKASSHCRMPAESRSAKTDE
jgi:hypothetical protein